MGESFGHSGCILRTYLKDLTARRDAESHNYNGRNLWTAYRSEGTHATTRYPVNLVELREFATRPLQLTFCQIARVQASIVSGDACPFFDARSVCGELDASRDNRLASDQLLLAHARLAFLFTQWRKLEDDASIVQRLELLQSLKSWSYNTMDIQMDTATLMPLCHFLDFHINFGGEQQGLSADAKSVFKVQALSAASSFLDSVEKLLGRVSFSALPLLFTEVGHLVSKGPLKSLRLPLLLVLLS